MKAGWPIKKLGELADQITDGTHNSPPYVDSGIPMLDSKHVKDGFVIDDTGPEKYISPATDALLAKRCKPSTGDILISSRGSIGKIAIVAEGQDFNIMGNMILIRLPAAISSKFAAFYLHSQVSHIESIARGVAQKGLYLNQVRDYELPLPPLPEQQRIVGILDEALECIATANANAEKNLQNARALFESHLHSVFTQQSDGWVERKLGDVCEYVNGKAHEQCIVEDGPFIVINSKFISSEGKVFKRSNKALLLLHPGDVAMVLSDVPNGKALAKCFLVEKTDTFTLNQRICLIRSNKFHTKFLFYQLNRNRHFLALDNGENQTNMRLNQVLNCPLFLPSIPEQETIAAKLDALNEETQRLESIYQQKLAALEALKKSLLHQAFTGQL